MKFAICDDNSEMIAHLKTLIEAYCRSRNVFIGCEAFQNATDLLSALEKKSFDLLLLDILMPGVNGMEAAHEIRNAGRELPILFLTSSPEFAVESYRIHAEDYLLKPIQRDDLFAAFDRLFEKTLREENFLLLKTRNGLNRIAFSKIVCVEVLHRIVIFTLSDGSVREVYGYLSEYEPLLLADPCFFKAHRSYLVNLRYVTDFGKEGFTTGIGKTIPIARDSFSKAKNAYLSYLFES